MPESFSVYVHLPYCSRRCPYCDFNTYVVHSMPEQRYAETLGREAAFAARSDAWRGRRIETVFFGGGTPSLFSPATIATLLATFDRLWGIQADAEISLEANPGTLEGGGEDKLRGFRSAGVSRISFGAQSFNAQHLATLGRIHSSDETRDAFGAARRAGFDNISCDLIYGIPGQSIADWRSDLDAAISLGSEHVSAYCLTYEDGTPMTGMKKAGLVVAADEDTELSMFHLARETFAQAGLAAYEISNYARPGRQCRHNLAYWTWRDYLGLGAGAHGFCSDGAAAGPAAGASPSLSPSPSTAPAQSWGRRYANLRLPELFMSAADGAWHASEERLTREMAIAEYLMVGLRLSRGVDAQSFLQQFGIALEAAVPSLRDFVVGGFIERHGEAFKLTTRGLEIADAVIPRLLA
ncbi:MAG TPA: radical SAM family heme chaperone HemW [Candidatus Binatia bacterium]|jgi:oxygen-independent coproporphyrinogen-3 oxidase